MKLSIVIPFHNEAGSAQSVVEEVLQVRGRGDEIIAVDDGSTDGTGAILAGLDGIRLIRLARNLGQSAALWAGLQAATGDRIATLDGDGQNDPADIGRMLALLESADLVIGYRARRRDAWSKRIASRVANGIRRRLLRDGVRDSGCGIKVFRREVVAAFIPFNGLHRFMPALAANAGFRVAECPVNHRPRAAGVSKYRNWERALRGVVDLFGVGWFLRRAVYPAPVQRELSHPNP